MKQRITAPLLGSLLVGAGLAASLAPADAADSVRRALSAPDGQIEVFIRLDELAVSEFNVAAMSGGGGMPGAEAQRAQAARVDAQQADFRRLLASYGAEELSALRVGANGLRVRVDASQLGALRSLPGVRSVAPVTKHTLDNITSVPWVGAPAVWANVGTGEGISIAVIDTGLDYLHANLGGAGDPAEYAANDPTTLADGGFNAKVVGGFDFVGDAYTGPNMPMPDEDPLDCNGHGSHVGGTAAGLGVAGSIGSGAAPGADLYGLKVFGCTGFTTVTSDAIEWAMDPNGDGDMSDHLDVINMSLGSSFGDPADPSAISTSNAAAIGIIVATSAGNSGDVSYVTGSPGVAPEAISTAAVTPGGRIVGLFDVNSPPALAGPKFALEGTSPVRLAGIPPITANVIAADPLNGCTAATNPAELAGNIALIIRGVCTFAQKSATAEAAGAVGMVVYNDGADPTRIAPIVMGGLAAATIPSVMISFTDGSAINASDETVNGTLSAGESPFTSDAIAGFSSRGPSHGGSGFKPDISAPGVSIVSTLVGSGTGSLNIQGTSMASPHTAGAAALLKQQHPSFGPVEVKALLQNSTLDNNPSTDTRLTRTGTGALHVDRASALTSYATPGGVSFGRVELSHHRFLRTDKITVTNFGDSHRHFEVTHVPGQTLPGVEVCCPANGLFVPKGRSRNFRIEMIVTPWEIPADIAPFGQATPSQREVDGWCVLDDGVDQLRVGYIAVIDPISIIDAKAKRRHGTNVVEIRNKLSAASDGVAEGFTWINSGGTSLDGTNNSILDFGFRRGNPAFYLGADVVEFGVSTEAPWEHISNLTFDIFIDADGDGITDVQLQANDLSAYIQGVTLGQYVTAQFSATAGFLDWNVINWDFNDQAVILPYTTAADTVFGGLVPESFDYVLAITGRDGSQDFQSGSVDFADEVGLSMNSFVAPWNTRTDVETTGGTTLWLFPSNKAGRQSEVE